MILKLCGNSELAFEIDDSDFEKVNEHKWYLVSGYVRTRGGERLHRFLLNPSSGVRIDHINRNKLDNRRSNLRVATAQQNMANSNKRNNCSSRYKGVSYCSRGNLSKRWVSYIRINGKRRYLGNFSSETEAAEAYNTAAREAFGDFANLNAVHNLNGKLAE